ncbi:MAG: c-type cytochrome [Candidatus Acidiferrales bacterium]
MRNKGLEQLAGIILMLAAMMGTGRAQSVQAGKRVQAADASKGEQVYEQKCEICHFRTATEKKIGPGLAGLMKREKFSNGMRADDDNLRLVIERGGKDMPGFRGQLNDAQIRDLIAYVKTL